jgi:hypothetical protein
MDAPPTTALDISETHTPRANSIPASPVKPDPSAPRTTIMLDEPVLVRTGKDRVRIDYATRLPKGYHSLVEEGLGGWTVVAGMLRGQAVARDTAGCLTLNELRAHLLDNPCENRV